MRTGQERLLSRLLAAGLLLLFFYLALDTALAKTLTSDEPSHIIRGVTLSQTGDLRFQLGHAPFSHRLIGSLLPLVSELPAVRELAQWEGGDRLRIAAGLLWNSGLNVDQFLLLVRLPVIFLGLLLGALAASWAQSWQGRLGMVVALTLFAASPNLVAHAALATTDLPTTAVYFATGFAWWRFWRGGQMRWWWMAAVLLGLALATKLTAILLLPVLLLQGMLLVRRVRDWWRPVALWAALLPIAFVSLWVVYGFEVGRFGTWPVLLPAPSYLASWQTVLDHVGAGHRSFFWGELSKRGWWYYFPAAYLIKTPLVTLALLLAATIAIGRRRDLWRTALFLLIPVGALFAAAIVSRLNIGYRHILPAVPFLLVYASATGTLMASRHRARRPVKRIALGLALTGLLLAALWRHPHHLAYFNPAVGGMAQGYRYLGDSNLDWGQDLKLLAQVVAADPEGWRVSYDGVSDPSYYGLPAEALMDAEAGWDAFAAANPPAGRYAISANHLQGLLPDADLFDWFRRQEPAYHLGGSILVYDVGEQMQGEWIAHCLDPLPLLTAAEAETLLGTAGARHLFFDCHQSFVLADHRAPGWLVLPQADAWWFQEALPLQELQLVYRHDAAAGSPSLDVYYWPGAEDTISLQGWSEEARSKAGEPLPLPYTLHETARLVGYQQAGEAWFTLWNVVKEVDQPLSLQAHLYATEASSPLVGDSLGFSSEQWRPGDWLLQRHSFPEQGARVSFLQTGLYNFQTLEPLGHVVRLPAR